MKGGFKKFSSRIGRWFSGDSEEFDLDFDIPDDDQPPPEEDKPPTAGGTLRGPPPDQLAAISPTRKPAR